MSICIGARVIARSGKAGKIHNLTEDQALIAWDIGTCEWVDEEGAGAMVERAEKTGLDKVAPVTKTSLLDAAKAAVADRGLNYGKPEANFDRIAALWSAHVQNRYADAPNSEPDMSAWTGTFDAADVAMMMVLMKVARLENAPEHLDSWTDIAGYAACGAEITNSENSA